MLDLDWLEKAAEKRRLQELFEQTSVGWALKDVQDRGLETHLETLEEQDEADLEEEEMRARDRFHCIATSVVGVRVPTHCSEGCKQLPTAPKSPAA